MKKLLILFVLFLLISCDKDDVLNVENDNSALTHAELGFELDEPDIILNEIAKGELNESITSVFLLMYGNTERKWEFEYVDNTDQISKMTFYLPHYQACEKNVFQFHYNTQNLIDSITAIRKNFCLEFEDIRKYTFNYNENGLLKSIFMDNESFVEENYFGYYTNGKIKEIYNSFRGSGDEKKFGVQKMKYNDSFTNVTEVEHKSGTNYHYTYKYFYDEEQNPFKDVFVAVSVFMPFIGQAHLSENNVIKMVQKNENAVNGFEFTTNFSFNYSANNKLLNYFYLNNERVYTINQ